MYWEAKTRRFRELAVVFPLRPVLVEAVDFPVTVRSISPIPFMSAQGRLFNEWKKESAKKVTKITTGEN